MPELFAEEFLCHRKYLRAVFHLRPQMKISDAKIEIDGATIHLTAHERDGYTELTADAIIPGIECAHEAIITVNEKSSVSGQAHVFKGFVQSQLRTHDEFYKLVEAAKIEISSDLNDFDVLEVGSRTRDDTKQSWGDLREKAKSYIGMDILAGPNVDVVGDVHKLSHRIEGKRFDFVYSQYVFEHLAMPWVAVSELNKVMRSGAKALIISNQSIGLHDIPWDFFRFSESAWMSLFNHATGFEILNVALGDAVRLTPLRFHEGFSAHENGAGFQASAVYVRKISDRSPTWDVDPDVIFSMLSRDYPEQIVG